MGKEQHFYSVPYKYVNQKATVIYDINSVEVYVKFDRIATHKRSFIAQGYTTVTEHMPPNHQAYKRSQKYNAAYFLEQAEHVGLCTRSIVDRILANRHFAQQNYKSCEGILSLRKNFGDERLESACLRIIDSPTVNYRMIKNILEKGLDHQNKVGCREKIHSLPEHENIRGAAHYK